MLTLISPAKTLDLHSPLPTRRHTEARLLAEAEELVQEMRRRSPEDLSELMGISPELAELNVDRFREFSTPFTRKNARPAVYMFDGDVYRGLDAAHRFDARDLTEAQKTLRILSGLYGVLRPLDLVQPYRLEMGTRVVTERGDNLYRWWGDRLTRMVAEDLAASPGPDALIDLASVEYSHAVDMDGLDARVVRPRFEDQSPAGDWKVISFPAKRARGLMAGWIVTERVRSVRSLREFAAEGYRYVPELSRREVLTAQTRADNARFFDGDVEAVPPTCVTQGLGTIMEARAILLVAMGEAKAEAVQHLVEGPADLAWPATVLQRHPSVTVLLDEAAASLLQRDEAGQVVTRTTERASGEHSD